MQELILARRRKRRVGALVGRPRRRSRQTSDLPCPALLLMLDHPNLPSSCLMGLALRQLQAGILIALTLRQLQTGTLILSRLDQMTVKLLGPHIQVLRLQTQATCLVMPACRTRSSARAPMQQHRMLPMVTMQTDLSLLPMFSHLLSLLRRLCLSVSLRRRAANQQLPVSSLTLQP